MWARPRGIDTPVKYRNLEPLSPQPFPPGISPKRLLVAKGIRCNATARNAQGGLPGGQRRSSTRDSTDGTQQEDLKVSRLNAELHETGHVCGKVGTGHSGSIPSYCEQAKGTVAQHCGAWVCCSQGSRGFREPEGGHGAKNTVQRSNQRHVLARSNVVPEVPLIVPLRLWIHVRGGLLAERGRGRESQTARRRAVRRQALLELVMQQHATVCSSMQLARHYCAITWV